MKVIFGWAVVMLALLAARGVSAAPPPQGDKDGHIARSTGLLTPLSFDALLVSEHPLVAAMVGAQSAHERSRRAMGPLDANPVVTLTPGVRVAGVEAPGPEWAIAISQDFAIGGQLQARADALALEGQQLAVAVEVERLERRLKAAHLWLDSWRLKAALDAMSEELVLCETSLEAARRAAARGAVTRMDVLVLESWKSDIALRRLSIEGQLFEVAGALGHALGGEMPADGSQWPLQGAQLPFASGALPTPPLPSHDTLGALIAGLPTQRLAELNTHVETARLRELEARRGLRLHVSLQVDADAEQNTGIRLGLGVPLPIFDRQDRDEPAQRARQTQQTALAESSARELRYRVFMLQHELHHSQEVVTEIAEVTLPAAERVVTAQNARLAAGEITVFELVDARRRRLDILGRQQDAEVAFTRVRLEAWLLWQAAAQTAPQGSKDTGKNR